MSNESVAILVESENEQSVITLKMYYNSMVIMRVRHEYDDKDEAIAIPMSKDDVWNLINNLTILHNVMK